jgi:hypothetical protein
MREMRPRGLLARLGFDGNPLRRTTDWMESATAVALLAAFLLVTPVVAMFAGQWAYGKGAAAERLQDGDRHRVQATVLESEPAGSATADGSALHSRATIRWTGPDARTHKGSLRVSPTAERGDRVSVWIDEQGRQVSPPLTHTQVVANAVSSGLLTFAGSAVLLGGVWFLVRRHLDRVRMDEWEADWLMVAPRWTDQGWTDPR